MTPTLTVTIQGTHEQVCEQIANLDRVFNPQVIPVPEPIAVVVDALKEVLAPELEPTAPKKRGRPKKSEPVPPAQETPVAQPGAEPASNPEPGLFEDIPDFLNRNKTDAAPAKPTEDTADTAKAAFKKLSEAKGLQYCIEFIGRFGVDRISLLPPAKFAEFVAAIEKDLAA